MKKVIITILAVGVLVGGGILLYKKFGTKSEGPQSSAEQKQTIIVEILEIVPSLKGIDVSITQAGLNKLTVADLASLKIALKNLKEAGSESAMTPENKKLLATIIPKLFKK